MAIYNMDCFPFAALWVAMTREAFVYYACCTRSDAGSACDDVFMTDTILCVDIGTTSLKAGLITADGEVVAFCSLPFEEPHDRFLACSWYDTFLRAKDELTRGAENANIVGISISGNGPTVVTESGLTFRWNEDTSAVTGIIPECARTSLFIPKILSIKNQFPEVWKKHEKLFSGPEYLIYLLTGNAVTIMPEDRFAAAYWNDDMLAACGIKKNLLPAFVKPGNNCGTFQDCPVIAGGPDFVVALIGTGTLQAGRLCDRCGSSEGLNFCTDRPVTGEGLRTLPSVIPGLWNVSYLIPDSGELSEAERLTAVEKGINCLKAAAQSAGIAFPSEMAVTGGQSNDELLLREKEQRLGMKILRPQENHFVHSELFGDACAGWFGLGVYESIQAAAEKIVRMRAYDNL